MAYELRPQKYEINYNESSDSQNSDPDYSRPLSRRGTRLHRSRPRRQTTRSIRAKENEMGNLSLNMRGRRGRLSKKRAEGDRNKKTRGAKASDSCMKRGSPSGEEPRPPKGLNSSQERHSSSLEGLSCVPKTILSWLIDCKVVEEDEEVCYMNGTKATSKTGNITRGGILCSCCHKEMSVWAFEKHASSDLKRPYENIYLPRMGKCLLDCQTAAWDESKEQRSRQIEPFVPKDTTIDKHNDACLICGDGGDLMCCEKCPSTFHSSCMNLKIVPEGDWLCPYCVCKFCGLDDCKQLFTCSQCDKKFHWACFREFEKAALKKALDLNCSRLYCEQSCREIHEKLESLVGVNHELDESYSWRVIRPIDVSPSARHQHVENNSKVAVACSLMNESFETIKDRHTDINVIQSVVYGCGSNITRINSSHFYTFILEKEDEMICAASIRIHGARIAEMPFIATAENHRGQGFGRMLLTIVESNLCSLKVKTFIVPSVGEACKKWWCKYDFKEVNSELRGELACYSMLMLPLAIRMQKDLGTQIIESANQNARVPENQERGNDVARRPLPDLNLEPPEEEEE